MINKHLTFLALDEDSLMFVYIRSAAFVTVVTQKLVLQQSKNVTAKCTETQSPLLLFNSPCFRLRVINLTEFIV